MRTIYLLRHAKSGWGDPGLADFDRPLAPRGKKALRIMGDYLFAQGISPDYIYCSTALRTRETLDAIQTRLDDKVIIQMTSSMYLAEPQVLLDLIKNTADEMQTLMLIGHNPGIHELACALASNTDDAALARLKTKYPTAGLTTLETQAAQWREVAPDCCQLRGFVVPRDLA